MAGRVNLRPAQRVGTGFASVCHVRPPTVHEANDPGQPNRKIDVLQGARRCPTGWHPLPRQFVARAAGRVDNLGEGTVGRARNGLLDASLPRRAPSREDAIEGERVPEVESPLCC